MGRVKHSIAKIVLLSLMAAVLTLQAVSAQDFIQGYEAETLLPKGSVVVRTGEGDTVKPADHTTNSDLLGVVVRSNDSAITLSSELSGVFVATSGKYEMLVSDLNGQVQSGDYITGSPIAGIAMRADERQELVVGRVLQDLDFTNSANILSTTELTDDSGASRQAAIGKLLVEVRVEDNPVAKGTIEQAPDFLINFGQTVAGKEVSPLRLYAALVVLIACLGLGGSMLYSTIKTSFVAIGRNPLAKGSVFAGMRQVIFVSILIFGAGFFGVYLLLRI